MFNPLFLISVLVAYLFGSISTAVLVCRFAGLGDPRHQGSNNPGATNVLRLGNKKLAAITLLGDSLKGYIPVAIILLISPSPLLVGVVMLAVLLGHLYPVFFQFKGGKGVATALGILFALSWWVGVLSLVTWLVLARVFKFSSLAALGASLASIVYVACCLETTMFVLWIPTALMTLLIFWRHRGNIARLMQGTESKIGQKA